MQQKPSLENTVDKLTDELNDYFTQIGKKQLKTKIPDLKLAIKKLIGDVLIIENKPVGRAFASIHLRANWYSGKTRYQNGYSYRIFVDRAYRGLVSLGYLAQAKAGVSHGSTGLYLTRYSATSKLLSLFDEKALADLPSLLTNELDMEETIRIQITLKRQTPSIKMSKYGVPQTRPVKHRELVDYEDTEISIQMRDNLKLINKRIASKWIDLELSLEERDDLVNTIEKIGLRISDSYLNNQRYLMRSKRKLYRVFNDHDFQTGGRFYGGWWQEIPSRYRDRITIDGKRTIQLDYVGLHPRILYHERGLQLNHDPYHVDLSPRKNTEDVAGFRKLIKQGFNAMLNADKWMQRAPRGCQLGSYGVTWKQIVNAIKARHPAIADQFFSGVGLRLQRADSDLAEEIMMILIQRCSEIVVLPVHDSFIVHHGYETELREAMVDAYLQKYGAMPKLKASYEMRVESTGVPDLGSWNHQSANDDSLLDLLELSESIPNERRLNLFRSRP